MSTTVAHTRGRSERVTAQPDRGRQRSGDTGGDDVSVSGMNEVLSPSGQMPRGSAPATRPVAQPTSRASRNLRLATSSAKDQAALLLSGHRYCSLA